MDGSAAIARRTLTALVLCALVTGGCASYSLERVSRSPSGVVGSQIVQPVPTNPARIAPPPTTSRPYVVTPTIPAPRSPLPFLPAPIPPAAPLTPGLVLQQEQMVVTPSQMIAPVGSEVVMLGGAANGDGTYKIWQRVEWMLAPDGVGQFVTTDDNHWLHCLSRLCHHRKVDNHYAVTRSSLSSFNITRGTAATNDDVTVQRGQSWISVTSPTEGTSYVTAYSPGVPGWELRKSTGTIHWVDAQWVFPPPSINPVGSKHVFTTTVSRHSNNAPVCGWLVRYEIMGGPAAGFGPDGAEAVEVPTDAMGQASVEIFQKTPEAGCNKVGIQVIRPPVAGAALTQRLTLGSGVTTKTWTAPQLALRVAGPAQASVGGTLTYRIEVTNPGDLATRDVVVSEQLPVGLTYLSSTPEGSATGNNLEWQLGTLAPRQTQVIEVNVRADQGGTFNHCATARGGNGLSAQDCVATTVTVPTLELSVTGPETAAVGSEVVFEVRVTNRSTLPVIGVVITDHFDPGFEHKVLQSPIERELTEEIPPGGSQRIGIAFRVAKAGRLCHNVEVIAAGGLKASAQVCLEATQGDTAPTEPPATLPPSTEPPATQPTTPPTTEAPTTPPTGQPAIVVRKTGPKQKRVGERAEFLITVQNTGKVPLTNVEITDSYELALEPVDASEGFTVGMDELVWKIARLEPGQQIQRQVRSQCVAAALRACNRVTVRSDQTPPIADEACVEILAASAPAAADPTAPPAAGTQLSNLRLSITDLGDPLSVGQQSSYRVFVTNSGQTADTAVRLSVSIPPEMTLIQASVKAPTRFAIDGQTIRFDPVAEIRAGETLTFTIPIQANRVGKARVTAEVTSTGLGRVVSQQETTEVLAK